MGFELRPFSSLFECPQRNGLTRPKRVRGSGYPMVNMGELFAHQKINRIEMDLVPMPDNEAAFFLEEGDLLFARQSLVLSGAGQCSIFLGNAKPTVFESHIIRCRLDKSLADPEFYFYFLKSAEGRAAIETIVEQGAGASGIRGSDLARLLVPCPPLPFQQKAASVLSVIDDRIDLLRQTNTTLEAIAQALFKSWFVDFDPVHAKAEGREPAAMSAATAALFPSEFEESELGLIPKGWSAEPIGEMVEGIYDGPHATPPEADEGPIFLGIKNLTGSALALSEIRHIAEDHYAQWTRRVTPCAGDIVFSYEATLGFFALIPESIRCCLGRRLALIRPRQEGGYGHFWFHQFLASPFQRMLEKHTIQGATVNRISLKKFPGYLVLDPTEAIKSAFESMVAPLWKLIHSNQAKSETLVALRDTLLPRLISGKLRLPDAEREIEAVA